ncbi:hypothetical protein BDV06DRAFT_231409 [Aspergillus oleicola]
MPNAEPVAVVGSACRFPGKSDTPSKLWELLQNPRDLLREVPPDRFNAEAFYHPDGKHHGTSNVRHSYFLDEDPTAFDNGFFNVPGGEAKAIDPQQRMLMETVYDSLCCAGQTIEGLRGTSTSVFVGVMCGDWDGMVSRDMESYPQYGATGTARSIMSNRISYFFDWHGPCMTIDTACSSSLVAVHQAIQTLHSGESTVAIAAGANLILSPAMYVAESKLSMLSPSGRSRMWDEDVDGYARGEGIAAVVLKPLSAAIRDNDPIECIIRGTGVNQDGRTPGLTMPSATAQAALIRDTYRRAGLDIEKFEDRPQFFHAHGTGTAAGDPQEAQAISEAFYASQALDDKLWVGSIKTIIGHTEGTAGLASLIGTSLALQAGAIPPNMHFNTLNPRLGPYYHHLEVPTECIPWPKTRPGQPRRASINSFGFGGTNAHAILEAYSHAKREPEQEQPNSSSSIFSPFTFSAASQSSLRSLLESYRLYLGSNPRLNLQDLAYSLQSRTSTLPYRVAITATFIDELSNQIDAILKHQLESSIGARQSVKSSPKLLGIFTGQGSQWARMGARLLEASPFVSMRLSELDGALAELPSDQRPGWTLQESILSAPKDSRVNDAAISQPVCTAIQIILVDLLRTARVKLHSVVGHSSGEIGAAYAAGLISDRNAIRTAYYRGLYAHLAKSPKGGKGSMLAVGTTLEDATEFCDLDDFVGRIQIAAQNSPSSITLSGDEDAVLQAIEIFEDEGKFVRQLKVDTAYHSAHVNPCCDPYAKALEQFESDTPVSTGTKWYSSVRLDTLMQSSDVGPQYWIENMASPVLFSAAVTTSWSQSGPFDMIIEVGPHPVLKTPCLDTIDPKVGGDMPPYIGVLRRRENDVHAFSRALGSIWTNLGPGSVDFADIERVMSQSSTIRQFLPDLPKYPFDHSRQFMTLSRVSGLYRDTQGAPHPLLGRRCQDRETSSQAQWRNILSLREMHWISGHRIQNQITLPATGYLCMAVEAIGEYVGRSNIGLIAIRDFRIQRAMIFSDDSPEVETLVDLRLSSQTENAIYAQFSCFSGAPYERKHMTASADGFVEVTLATPEAGTIPGEGNDDFNLNEVTPDRFYKFLSGLGYNYTPPFQGITSIRRKADYAIGTINDQSGSQWEDNLIVHPGMLDTALQTGFAAFCCPGDERLWGLHLPTGIRSVLINPYFTPVGLGGKQSQLQYLSTSRLDESAKLCADVSLVAGDCFDQIFLQIEGIDLVPLAPALPSNDAVLFSTFEYRLASPDGTTAAASTTAHSRDDVQLAMDEERIAFYYFRRLLEFVTAEEAERSLPHYRYLFIYAGHMISSITRGEHPYIPASAKFDTAKYIDNLIAKHPNNVPVRLLQSVGSYLPEAMLSGSSILEHMVTDSMWDHIYEEGPGIDQANESIAQMVSQIAHRYPSMDVFEIGAGTGGSTKRILQTLGPAFSTYTYTDVSSSFLSKARDLFKDYQERIIFKTFDMNQSPDSQNFVEGAYDVVIGSNVLHATVDMHRMMRNVRRLLRPGGYLIILETVDNNCLRLGLTMGSLPGWWLGAENGRQFGPTLSLPQWDTLLESCGFGGIDTTTPPIHPLFPFHVFCAQALNERVEVLRDPITHLNQLPSAPSPAPHLVLVGGKKFETHRICGRLVALLSDSMFAHIYRVQSIEELNANCIVEGSTLLSLTELDQPLFATSTPQKFDSLKTIWRQTKNILWVTRGARAENPHSQMMFGIGRCMRSEYPNITMQMLDIDAITKDTGGLIAKQLIQLELLSRWSTESEPHGGGKLMWSLEPEVCIENGAKLIPRCYPYDSSNKRYNTTRRVVTEHVDPQQADLTFAVEENYRPKVQRHSPLNIQPALPFTSCRSRSIRVTQFLLPTLAFVSGARLRLCVGIDTSTQERLLAASPTETSPAVIPSDWCFAIDNQTDSVSALCATSSYLVARSISQLVGNGDFIILHEPSLSIVNKLRGLLRDKSVTLQVTTSQKKNATQGWVYVDKNFPERVVKNLLPPMSTIYFDLSAGSETSGLITKCLPRNSRFIDPTSLFSHDIELRRSVVEGHITDVLRHAYDQMALYTDGDVNDIPVTQVDNLTNSITSSVGPFVIADCTGPSMQALVRSIDEGTLFHSNKAYLLVGLSGELGQSLCKWMVLHGARYVVLTSRQPKVNPKFTSAMQRLGATIKILPMDVTDRESALECYETVVKTMPPIAGVVNGAMVLKDNLFENMPYEDFKAVTDPKVIGSIILDELFHDDKSLDFFIFFSSASVVTGNSGQSNYAAANQFMSSLANQRKKRGLAASSIDITSIIGIGYVERDTVVDEFTFARMGYRTMSEQDLHCAFAEAILIGRPDYQGSCELVTGVKPLRPGDQALDQLFTDPRFGHFIRRERAEEGATSTDNVKGAHQQQPIKVQLAAASSKAAVFSIIKDSFHHKLRRILAVPSDEPINDKVTFVEQGIDSLMAIEVRSWFLKELGIDFPALRILGGGSIADLLEEVVGLLPSSVVDISRLDIEDVRREEVPPQEPPAAVSTKEGEEMMEEDRVRQTNLEKLSSTPSTGDMSETPSHPPVRTPMSETVTPASEPDEAKIPGLSESEMTSTDAVTCRTSFSQNAFLVLDEYLTDKTAFNMAVMFKMTGSLKIGDLEEAVTMVARRHEILRTRFFWASGGKESDGIEPMQGIASVSSLRLSQENVVSETHAQDVLERVRNELWDLSSRDTARVHLLTLSDNIHFLVLSMHHVMADAYSFSILIKDLDAAYMSKSLPLLPLESQYRSFANQQRQFHKLGRTRDGIQYFKQQLSSSDDKTYLQPIRLLPFARSTTRQPLTTYSQEEAKIQIGSDLNDRVRDLARKNKCTTFHVYLSALQLLLFNLLPNSTPEEIFIGIADANRRDKSFGGTVGLFLNLLPLRFSRSSPHTSLASVIQNARDTAYAALSRSGEVPFDVLLQELNVPRSNDHTPLFQVFLDYKQIAHDLHSLAGCRLSDPAWRNTSTGYDIALDVNEHMHKPAIIHLRLQSALYSKESAKMLLRSYISVLEHMTDAKNGGTVGDVPTWSTPDIQAVLAAGSGTPLNPQWPATMSERLDDMSAKYPTKIALKDGDGVVLTYKQLGARIDCVANKLLSLSKGHRTVVGVFQQPSGDWICSMLAVLRVGCVYLPLDMRNGLPRLASIVKTAQPSVILTDSKTTDNIAHIGAGYATEVLVSGLKTPKQQPTTSINYAKRDVPAVMLFTSGTTGEPKGIIMRNENLIANAEASSRVHGHDTTPDLVVLQQTAFSFDVSLDQILAALLNGGCLYVVPARCRGDPSEISKIMLHERVTYTSGTPAEYAIWLRYASDTLARCTSWKQAICGGEAMSRNLALQFRTLSANLPRLRVFHGYGPTEATCFTTKFELDYESLPDTESLPAGFLHPGYTCIIADEDSVPVPPGVSGEILIGGPCVVSGYLKNPEPTRQRFIRDTFFGTSGMMYRSGDRGRLLADGTLYVDGRLEGDTQIKLRGFRIELAEIEKALVKHAGGAVSHAVVTLRGGSGEGEGYLVAHVAFAPDYPRDAWNRTVESMRYGLALPPYMRPSAIVSLPLEDFPLTPHLKVDRRAVQALPVGNWIITGAGSGADNSNTVKNLTESEQRLSDLWRQIMPLDPGPLTPDSDFFLVGGNSILLVKLQQQLKKSFSAAAPSLVNLMGAPTLRAMAEVVRASRPSTETIDWEAETQLPEWAMGTTGDSNTASPRCANSDALTVLLTGASGFLGRHLLRSIINDRRISRVFCLARYNPADNYGNTHSKVTIIESGISQPNLGISHEEYNTLAAEVDAIVHCAANRSLWDQYEVIRPDNYDSIRQLARLATTITATGRTVPLHVLSSGAVSSYESHPPQDGSDGYVATKWAAEGFLYRFAAASNIPVYIHRPEPTPIPYEKQTTAPDNKNIEIAIDRLAAIASTLAQRPALDGVKGEIHLAPVGQVVEEIHQSLFPILPTGDEVNDTRADTFLPLEANPRILHHVGTVRIGVKDLDTRLNYDKALRYLPTIPVLDWLGKAKLVDDGLGFEYLITSWEFIIGSGSGSGREVVSRR